ncbi:CpaF family protein [Actinomarinicola tropica]|uniref:CpaF family protein n=1 Tax=Actinomarinicola tropica TaxID=2789776 RepID=A0A5Q2RM20_9ACTN|nr:CpaF family protein [Actinomarinicola tropica]QGG96524.1 CpaF family protein [Actinomarinicola tropica]
MSAMTAVDLEQLVESLHRRLLDEWPAIDPHDVIDVVRRLVRAEAPLLGPASEAAVVDAVAARVHGLGPLDPLLADPTVTEVMLNGGGRVWVERAGRVEATDLLIDEPTALRLVERIVAPLGLRVDRSSPMVDARLPDGSRVHAVVRPLAVDGPCLTVRRFGARAVPLEAFAPPPVVELLRAAVLARRNVVVSGGTGAGKTTLLNALAAAIPVSERVLTIEDAAELRLPGEHVVRLESRPANAEGHGAVTIRELVRTALRMRPDRIVVGEVRGPEALDMLQAMNTGHDGSLSTCHANSPDDALRRVETLSLLAGIELPLHAVREQLASAIDVVVQVGRTSDGGRRIVAVGEPVGDEVGGVRCRPLVRGDQVVATPTRPGRAVG